MKYTNIFFNTTLIALCSILGGCAARLATVSSSAELKKNNSDTISISQKTALTIEQTKDRIEHIEIEFFPPAGDSTYASAEPKVKKITSTRILTQRSSEEKIDTTHLGAISVVAEEYTEASQTETPLAVTSRWKYIFYSIVLLSVISAAIYVRRLCKGRLF